MGSVTLTASDNHTLEAYTAGPETATKGLVVVQEIFGLNKYIRFMADTFADIGYKVIAPAMFDRVQRGTELGYGPDDVKVGIDLRSRISEEMSLEDISAAARSLGLSSVGITGYCFGGTMAFLGATRSREFQAASCWYGGGIAKARDEKANCPVQMHFGETDFSISMTDVAAIKAAQPNAEVYAYPGAGHGFGCAHRESYDNEAYELALRRTVDFFAKNL